MIFGFPEASAGLVRLVVAAITAASTSAMHSLQDERRISSFLVKRRCLDMSGNANRFLPLLGDSGPNRAPHRSADGYGTTEVALAYDLPSAIYR